MHATIWAVILTYNDAVNTEECYRSLQGGGVPDYAIVIVDNGSESRIVDEIERWGRGVTVLHNKANLGFAAGMNVGIRYAIDHGAQWVLVLNNDTVVEKDCVSKLAEQAGTADPHVGILAPKIRMYAAPQVLWYAGSRRGFPFTRHRGMGELDLGQYDVTQHVTFASGCALMMSARLLREVGLFDEAFFFGMEDHEYSDRCLQAGFHIVYCPQAVVYHKVGATRGRLTAETAYRGYHAQFLYLRRRTRLWPLWYVAYSLYLGWGLPLRLGGVASNRAAVVGAAFRALADSIMQKPLRCR